MSDILDRGSLLWACAAVLVVSLLLQASVLPLLIRAQMAAESAAAINAGAPAENQDEAPPGAPPQSTPARPRRIRTKPRRAGRTRPSRGSRFTSTLPC